MTSKEASQVNVMPEKPPPLIFGLAEYSRAKSELAWFVAAALACSRT